MANAVTGNSLHLLNPRLGRLRVEEQRFISQLMVERVFVKTPQQFPARAAHSQVIPNPGGADIEPVIGCAKQKYHFSLRQVGMLECQSVSVEFLEIRFGDQRFHSLAERSS